MSRYDDIYEEYDNDDETPMNNFIPVKKKNNGTNNKKKSNGRGQRPSPKINKRKTFIEEEREFERYKYKDES